MRKKIMFCFIFSSVFLLTSCDHHSKKNDTSKTNIVVATLTKPTEKLYYTGVLSPLTTVPVVSSVDGNLVSRDFTYGESIHKGQQLFVIQSEQLSDSYRKSVSAYLQKKQAYVLQKSNFKGSDALYKAGIISKNQYLSDKSQYENSALDYFQTEYDLKKVLHTAGVDFEKIESLSLSDTAKINHVLQTHFHHIVLYAPDSGVALFPTEKDSDGHTAQQLHPGDAIKENQLLLSIGDLSGLSATFDVTEMDVDKLKPGMKAYITSSAFPNVSLNGVVTAVSSQANVGSSQDSISEFSVRVQIPQVSKAAMKVIRVGMTAKFEIQKQRHPAIFLPIQAVITEQGKSSVMILDQQNKPKKVMVKTGDTTLKDVEITSGVKPGDKIIVGQ